MACSGCIEVISQDGWSEAIPINKAREAMGIAALHSSCNAVICERACDKPARRANHFRLSEIVSRQEFLRIENKTLAASGKSDA
jgi:hypothetical protein